MRIPLKTGDELILSRKVSSSYSTYNIGYKTQNEVSKATKKNNKESYKTTITALLLCFNLRLLNCLSCSVASISFLTNQKDDQTFIQQHNNENSCNIEKYKC